MCTFAAGIEHNRQSSISANNKAFVEESVKSVYPVLDGPGTPIHFPKVLGKKAIKFSLIFRHLAEIKGLIHNTGRLPGFNIVQNSVLQLLYF